MDNEHPSQIDIDIDGDLYDLLPTTLPPRDEREENKKEQLDEPIISKIKEDFYIPQENENKQNEFSVVVKKVESLHTEEKQDFKRRPPENTRGARDIPLSTFNDLVLYNAEGKPYIDVNKLVYNPKSRTKKEVKEKFSSYFPDYVFFVCNFIGLLSCIYILVTGMQSSLWDQSIESVSSNLNEKSNNTKKKGTLSILHIKDFKSWTPNGIGAFLVTIAIFNMANILLGTFACINGYKFLLLQHLIVYIILVLAELCVAIIIVVSGICLESDMLFFQKGIEYLISDYLRPTNQIDENEADDIFYSTTLLNDIQTSMQCCGASNWTDYLNLQISKVSDGEPSRRNYNPATSNQLFPYSCCTPWWIRNIHCSSGIHALTVPGTSSHDLRRFRERISQTGCAPKVWLGCKRLLFAVGHGLLINTIFNILLILIEAWSTRLQMRNLKKILEEMRIIERVKSNDRDHLADSSTDDASEEDLNRNRKYNNRARNQKKKKSPGYTSKKAGGAQRMPVDDLKAKLALPTEDEIEFIKSRTAFAQFELRMQKTNIGRLMAAARDSVAPPDMGLAGPPLESLGEKPHHHHLEHHRHYEKIKSINWNDDSVESFDVKKPVYQVDDQKQDKKNKQLLRKKHPSSKKRHSGFRVATISDHDENQDWIPERYSGTDVRKHHRGKRRSRKKSDIDYLVPHHHHHHHHHHTRRTNASRIYHSDDIPTTISTGQRHSIVETHNKASFDDNKSQFSEPEPEPAFTTFTHIDNTDHSHQITAHEIPPPQETTMTAQRKKPTKKKITKKGKAFKVSSEEVRIQKDSGTPKKKVQKAKLVTGKKYPAKAKRKTWIF